jgi:hypothetical protein
VVKIIQKCACHFEKKVVEWLAKVNEMKEKRMKVITRFVCLILACVLFLNGPCYEIVEAHTDEMCKTTEAQETISQRSQTDAKSGGSRLMAMCAGDIGEMVFDDNKKNRPRVSGSLIHVPGSADVMEDVPTISKRVSDEDFCGDARRDEVIIHYLHRTDGEK